MSLKIAIYTPVKNEAGFAARWAQTTAGADVRLWYDTGSTDDTIKEAARSGITVVKGFIDPWRWDDGRNAALHVLPSDLDLCIHLDADEVLVPNWRKILEAHPGHSRYSYRLINGDAGAGWDVVKRANIHARSGYRWRHPIHEALDGPPATCDLPEFLVTHFPDRTKSRDHYLGLMELACREEPDNCRMAFYLAREYNHCGKWIEARGAFERYLKMPSAVWPAERAEAYRILAHMDYFPERWLLKAIAEEPMRREPWVDLARFYMQTERYQEAFGAWSAAARRTDRAIYTTQQSAWDMPFDFLGQEINRALSLNGSGRSAISSAPEAEDAPKPGSPKPKLVPVDA